MSLVSPAASHLEQSHCRKLQMHGREKKAERDSYKGANQNEASGTLCPGVRWKAPVLWSSEPMPELLLVEGRRQEGGKVRKGTREVRETTGGGCPLGSCLQTQPQFPNLWVSAESRSTSQGNQPSSHNQLLVAS